MRSLKKLVGISIALATLTTPGFAQPSETASELLRKVAASYRGATSYRFEATETTRTRTADLDRVQERRLATARDASQRWRVEIEDSVQHTIAVVDGRMTTTYRPASGQYTQEENPPSASAASGVANLLNYFVSRYGAVAERMEAARMLRAETQQVEGRSVACTVIEADYAAPAGSAVTSLRRTFWIEPAQTIVLREESEAQVTSPSGEKTVLQQTISFRSAALGGELAGDLFSFTPPQIARKVESFEAEPDRASFIGNPAPFFSLTSLDGRRYSLESLRGKPILLNFWASWCVPCRLEMPLLEEFHREWASQGLVVLGVNDEAPEIARRFLEEQGYTFPTLADETNAAGRAYAVESIPTTVGIDKTGRVAFQHAGAQSKKELLEALTVAGFLAAQ